MIQTRGGNSNGGAYIRSAAKAIKALRDYGPMVQKAGNQINRYFRGDVNQPRSANTTQQVRVMRPVRAARQRRSPGGAATVIEKGSLKLADVTTSAIAGFVTSGSAIQSLPLQLEFIGGRLFAMSKLYSRWKFISAILRYVPAVSSATDGALVIYYTQEPDDTYVVGESVGAGNATSAIDNMEFSVREKMSMPLHLNPQLLYTTPSGAEKSWHSAGVVNIVSNGALTTSKTYGSIYMDFVVEFMQPCAPFDPYAPLFDNNAATAPTGPGATGTANGAVFNWTIDNLYKFNKASGPNWQIDPITGNLDAAGKIWLPPYSGVSFMLNVTDTAAVAANLALTMTTGLAVAGTQLIGRDAANTYKWYYATIVNQTALPGSIQMTTTTVGSNIGSATLLLAEVPYKST